MAASAAAADVDDDLEIQLNSNLAPTLSRWAIFVAPTGSSPTMHIHGCLWRLARVAMTHRELSERTLLLNLNSELTQQLQATLSGDISHWRHSSWSFICLPPPPPVPSTARTTTTTLMGTQSQFLTKFDGESSSRLRGRKFVTSLALSHNSTASFYISLEQIRQLQSASMARETQTRPKHEEKLSQYQITFSKFVYLLTLCNLNTHETRPNYMK